MFKNSGVRHACATIKICAGKVYLFGSYAYGNPTEESDIDIYVVTPDDIGNLTEIYAKIIGELGEKKIYFIDLLLGRETVFNKRKENNIFEKSIYQSGKLLYDQCTA